MQRLIFRGWTGGGGTGIRGAESGVEGAESGVEGAESGVEGAEAGVGVAGSGDRGGGIGAGSLERLGRKFIFYRKLKKMAHNDAVFCL